MLIEMNTSSIFSAGMKHSEKFAVSRPKKGSDVDDLVRKLAASLSDEFGIAVATKRSTVEEEKKHVYDFYLENMGPVFHRYEFLFRLTTKWKEQGKPEKGIDFKIESNEQKVDFPKAKNFVKNYLGKTS